jgi:hypothetical protein
LTDVIQNDAPPLVAPRAPVCPRCGSLRTNTMDVKAITPSETLPKAGFFYCYVCEHIWIVRNMLNVAS